MLKRFDPFPESLQHDGRLRQGSYADISERLQALLEEVRSKLHYLDRLISISEHLPIRSNSSAA
jgi:hypothetical protein